MEKISGETYDSLRKLCRKLTLAYPTERWDGSLPQLVGVVPDDVSIDRSKGDYFVLFGEYYWSYHEVLNRLRKELALEYLEDRELKEKLWHFICEIIARYRSYRDTSKLKAKIDEFLSNILKPLADYEVLVPILHLDTMGSKIKIGKIIVKTFNTENLEGWGVPREEPAFTEIVNKSMAIIPEEGNNPRLVCERARRKADFVIRVLQASLLADRFVHDEQTLYEQGKFIVYRESGKPSETGLSWQRGYEPISLKIDERLEKSINDFLGKIPEILEEKLPARLQERFVTAIMWLGRAIDEQDPNIKIAYLSTALEAMLTTPSDEEKGETLAYRMLLLNVHVDKPFTHPAKVLWIYELRSKIIHGSTLAIASKDEYYTMRHVVMDTLLYSLEVIRREGLKSHAQFLETLEAHKDVEKILRWLEDQGDERSLKIKEHMERKLGKRLA